MQAGAISIGRNVGTTPLDDSAWAGFVTAIHQAIRTEDGTIYATAYGRGEWEGIAEDNAVVTFEIPSAHKLGRLRWRLGQLAKTYQQDAIALLVGETTLVGAA